MRYARPFVISLIVFAVFLLGPDGRGGVPVTEAVFGVADPSPGVVAEVAIDMDPFATPANPDNGLIGTIETCKSVAVAGTIDIDIVIDEVDPADLLQGYQVNLNFDDNTDADNAGTVSVAAVSDWKMTGANFGSNPLLLSDGTPDAVSPFMAAAADLGPNPSAYESGEGVLARITLTGVHAGISALTLSNVQPFDQSGSAIPVTTVTGAWVAVGTPCPAAGTDLKIISQTHTAPPDMDVSVTEQFQVIKEIHNNGPEPNPYVNVTASGDAPVDCDISYHANVTGNESATIAAGVHYTHNGQPGVGPATFGLGLGDTVVASGTQGVGNELAISFAVGPVPISTPFQIVEDWDKHCYVPSNHQFVITNQIWPNDPAVTELNPADNEWVTVIDEEVWAYTDLQVIQAVTFPAQINASEDATLTIDKTLHNAGPLSMAGAIITKTISLPPDCTLNGQPNLGPYVINVPPQFEPSAVSAVLQYQELDTVHCTEPSFHQLTVENCVDPIMTDPHVIDPDPTSNCPLIDVVDFEVVSDADLKVTSLSLGGPQPVTPDVFVSEIRPVSLVVHNNGPDSIQPTDLWVELSEESPGWPGLPDSDTDNWVDNAELLLKSDPNDGNSTPEALEVPGTCTDGQDNDGFYGADAADPKCTDLDGDGFSDALELLTGSGPWNSAKTPEHAMLPWTCNDGVDNDLDGTYDDANHSATPESDGDADGFGDCSLDQLQQVPLPAACVSGWVPVAGDFPRMEVGPDGTITVSIEFTEPALGVSVPVVIGREVVFDCFIDGTFTETIAAFVTDTDIHVNDTNPLNNSSAIAVQVEPVAAGSADVKILDWTINPPPPASIQVSETVDLNTVKTLHNNGPDGPVTVSVTKTMDVPPGCDGSVVFELGDAIAIAAGVTYIIDTDGDTVVDVGPLVGPTVIPPPPMTPGLGKVFATGLTGLVGPEITVFLDVVLPVSTTVPVPETFDMHCSEASTHAFSLGNIISINDPPGFIDPDPTNNNYLMAVVVDVIGTADLKLQSQTVTFPPDINVSQDVPLIVDKVIHNNGPYGPVDVAITKTFTLPTDCTVNGQQGPQVVITDTLPNVDVSVGAPFQETDSIHCTQSSDHQIIVDNCIAPVDPHVNDPDPTQASNCKTNVVNFAVNAVADGEIIWAGVTNAPPGMLPDTDYNVTVHLDLHNNGPFGPANFDLSRVYSAPGVCTVTPPAPLVSHSLPVSVSVIEAQVWTINCPEGGPYEFWFDYTLTANQFHVVDPNLANNERSAYLSVCAFTDPATVVNLDCDGDGFTGTVENHVYAPSVMGDHDACGTNSKPPTNPPSPIGWPADLAPTSGPLISDNFVTILDITSFLSPRYLDTDVGVPPGPEVRWDLVPGPGFALYDINILDLTALISLAPPMLGGAFANNGPECPYPP